MPLINPGIQSGYTVNGPAAGVMADQQYNDWIESQQRANRDQDLRYLSDENRYQQDLLDNPVKAAERGLKTEQVGSELKLLPEKTAAAFAKLEADQSDSKIKVAENRADFVYRTSQQFAPDTFSNPAKKAYSARLWEQAQAEGARLGVKMPDFSEEGLQEIQAKGQQAGLYLKHRQQMDIEKLKSQTQKDVAQTGYDRTVEAARIMAAREVAGGNDANRIIKDIEAKVKAGEPLNEADIEKAKLVFEHENPKGYADLMKSKEALSSALLASKTDREKKAKELGMSIDTDRISSADIIAKEYYNRELDREALKWVKKRFNEESLPRGANQVKPTSLTNNSNADEQRAKSSFGSYEPDRYNYGMVNGRWGRWPKVK